MPSFIPYLVLNLVIGTDRKFVAWDRYKFYDTRIRNVVCTWCAVKWSHAFGIFVDKTCRNASIIFAFSICPFMSMCMWQKFGHGTNWHKFQQLKFVSKFIGTFQVWIKSEKRNLNTYMYFYVHLERMSLNTCWNEKYSGRKIHRKSKCISFSVTLFVCIRDNWTKRSRIVCAFTSWSTPWISAAMLVGKSVLLNRI
jgi:hypothetical protein